MNQNPKVSVIIPAYNEIESIEGCLSSLLGQSYKNIEVIVVDDGSSDETPKVAIDLGVQLLKQKHKGPGVARNLGASKAKGEILIFVDADMTFEKDFVKSLIAPIAAGKTKGTFSKEEMVKNQNDPISICWNINRNLPKNRMIPESFPDKAPVFRAILKKEFDRVKGFETSGQYTDDWSLSRKLGYMSTDAPGAIYYHVNPNSYGEVWKQARWIGKNEFISGNYPRRIKSLILYSFPCSLFIGALKTIINRNPRFLVFKPFYDLAIFISALNSPFTKNKAK